MPSLKDDEFIQGFKTNIFYEREEGNAVASNILFIYIT